MFQNLTVKFASSSSSLRTFGGGTFFSSISKKYF